MAPDDVCINGTRIRLNVTHIAASLWADWYIIRPIFAQWTITFVHCRPHVFDVGPTLYKSYRNVLCLLGYGQENELDLSTLWCIRKVRHLNTTGPLDENYVTYIVPSDIKGCICHFVK